MKGIFWTGIALIIFGFLGIVYRSVTFTSQEKFFDLGAIHATRDKKETVPISPVLSSVALVCGVLLVVAGSRSKNQSN
jgi:hypothetical protein